MVGGAHGIGHDARILERDPIRDVAEVFGLDGHVLRIAALAGHSHITPAVLAERLLARAAEVARPAGEVEVHGDPVAGLDVAHPRAHLSHDSRHLVAYDPGEARHQLGIGLHDDHREAHARGLDIYQGLADAGLGHIPFLELHRPSQLMHHHRFHDDLLLGAGAGRRGEAAGWTDARLKKCPFPPSRPF